MSAKPSQSAPVDFKPCQRPQALATRALSPAMKARTPVRNDDGSKKPTQKGTRRQSHQHPPNAFATSLSTLTRTASCPDTQPDEPQVDQQSSKPITKVNVLRIQARGVFCRLFQSAKRSLALDQQLNRNQFKAQSQRPSTPKPVISYPKKLHNPHLACVVNQDVWAEQIGSTSPSSGRHLTYPSGRPLRSTRPDVHVQSSLTTRRSAIRASPTKTSDGAATISPLLRDDRPAPNPLNAPQHVPTRNLAIKTRERKMNTNQASTQPDAPTTSLNQDSQAAKLESNWPSKPLVRLCQRSSPGSTPSRKDKRCKSAVMKVFFEPIKDDITLNIITCPQSPSLDAGSTPPSPLLSLPPSPASSPPPPLLTLLQSTSSPSHTGDPRPLQRLALAELDWETDPITNENQSPWYNDLMNSIDQTIGKAAPSISR